MLKICSLFLFLFALLVPVTAQAANTQTYKIRIGDKLSVKFLYHPELNEASVTVRPDGLISLQLIEEIPANGLTATELTAALLKSYREVLLNPVITVTVVDFVPPRVFVAGQVNKPGSYELRSGQTVFEMVALAGGFTNLAHRKTILLAHRVNGQELKVTTLDFTQLMKSKPQDLKLEDGDFLFIPDSKMSTFTRMMEAFRLAAPAYQIR